MRAGAETARIIRVFVSSPEDVSAERDVLEEAVTSINRADGRSRGYLLDLFRGERDVVPQIGPKRQKIIDSQTPPYDIYLGILKHRFGEPTGRFGSGTQKEFNDALEKWKAEGSPWILFYFCGDAVRPGDLDLQQYSKVDKFRRELDRKQEGIYATWVGVRGSDEGFFEKVSEHLRSIAQRMVEVQPSPLPVGRTSASLPKIKILFLASQPDDQARLRLDREFREIDARIRAADCRDQFELVSRWAVRTQDLRESLLRDKPQIVHFGGHGSSHEELLLENSAGFAKPVSKTALEGLFRILQGGIRVVVLNACFSKPQAEAIAGIVECAVGMSRAIGDQAAFEFATTFYQALGYGKSIQTAFELGRNAIELEGISEQDTPRLLHRSSVDPTSIYLTGDAKRHEEH